MSIIAAGTTTTTALSSTGNTDGTLQFQVNGTTPSVTLNTLGAIGVGSTPAFGTSGQVLTSAGSTAAPAWATPSAVNLTTGVTGTLPISNGGTGTTSTTFANLTTNVTGTLPIANGGTGTTSTTFANLATNVTGTLPVANGGTGQTALSAVSVGTSTNLAGGSNGTIPYQSAAGTTQMLAAGTSGQILTSSGAGAPTWAAPAGGGSMIYISTTTASSATYLDITGMDGTYDQYVILGSGVRSTASAVPAIRVLNAGTPYTSSYSSYIMGSSTAVQVYTSTAQARIAISTLDTNYEGQLILNVYRSPTNSNGQGGDFTFTYSAGTGSGLTTNVGGWNVIFGTMNGIRIFDFGFSSTDWLIGTFRLYGIKKS
jgi:hypothetical protein